MALPDGLEPTAFCNDCAQGLCAPASYDFDSLSERQRNAMMWLMMGQDSFDHFSGQTVASLVKRGLIEKVGQKRGIETRWRYLMPIPVHLAWCAWCAKNCAEEGETD